MTLATNAIDNCGNCKWRPAIGSVCEKSKEYLWPEWRRQLRPHAEHVGFTAFDTWICPLMEFSE